MKFHKCSPGVFMLCFLLLGGCVPARHLPPRTALEIREIQTRQYELADQRRVMKAVLNVLQDQGFVTKNAVTDLGLITATKEIDRETPGGLVFGALVLGSEPVWEKAEVIDATANVTEFGSGVRVRVSFQRKILDNRGGIVRIEEIQDPKYYQNFLVQVDKGVFIEKERL